MKWNGRPYRPANSRFITKKKPFDFEEALKPLGEKELPVWNSVVAVNVPPSGGPVVVTPTPTNTPTQTQTPTQTTTPTPSLGYNCLWENQQSLWENDTNQWQVCSNLPTPTPSPSPSSSSTTPTPTPTPSSTPLPGYGEALTYMNAVLNAGGYLDSTMSAATIQLFVDLNSDTSWSKLDAFYPFMGSSLGGFTVNGKNPGTHDITWSGGLAINQSGVTGNGINGHGNTNYAEYPHAQVDNQHIGIYILTDKNESVFDMGTVDPFIVSPSIGNSKSGIDTRETNLTYYALGIDATLAVPSNTGTTDSRGYWIVSRTGSTSTTLFHNGTIDDTDSTVSSGGASQYAYYIAARNNSGTAANFSTKLITFVTIGKGLNQTQASNLSTHINTFLTTLNRNSY